MGKEGKGKEKAEETSGATQEGDACSRESEGSGATSSASSAKDDSLTELRFEDVAERVWVPEASAGEANSNCSFLSRVAPVNMEKALKALYQAGYDHKTAERALKEQRVAAGDCSSKTGGGGGSSSCGSSAAESSPRNRGAMIVKDMGAEKMKLAQAAFMKHGRNLYAVQMELQWGMKNIVEYYYSVWKFSSSYPVSEASCNT